MADLRILKNWALIAGWAAGLGAAAFTAMTIYLWMMFLWPRSPDETLSPWYSFLRWFWGALLWLVPLIGLYAGRFVYKKLLKIWLNEDISM